MHLNFIFGITKKKQQIIIANILNERMSFYDKKIYVWANDGGERVQIAISLTCPKNPIEIAANVDTDGGDWDFSDDAPTNTKVAVANAAPAEITAEEKANIAELMAKLGL